MRWLLLLPLLAAFPAGAGDAEFRDCPECPLMIRTPGGMLIGKYPVTRGEFRAFAEATGLAQDGCVLRGATGRSMVKGANWLNPGFVQDDTHPVVCVSWIEATAYAEWLTRLAGTTYRLPTVEESAEAAAAGATTTFWWGDDFAAVCKHANVADRAYARAFPTDTRKVPDCDDGFARTSPVGSFPANAWGLQDVAGNVWTWTNSCLKGDCANAVFRGGGWDVPNPKFLETDGQFGDRIVLRNDVIGFRVLRE